MYLELKHMKILFIALLIGPMTAVAYAQKMDRRKTSRWVTRSLSSGCVKTNPSRWSKKSLR